MSRFMVSSHDLEEGFEEAWGESDCKSFMQGGLICVSALVKVSTKQSPGTDCREMLKIVHRHLHLTIFKSIININLDLHKATGKVIGYLSACIKVATKLKVHHSGSPGVYFQGAIIVCIA